MTTPARIKLFRLDADNIAILDSGALSLLYGVDFGRPSGEGPTGRQRQKQAMRRTKEATAHGAEDLYEALEYWAAKDHGAVIEYDAVHRVVYMVPRET